MGQLVCCTSSDGSTMVLEADGQAKELPQLANLVNNVTCKAGPSIQPHTHVYIQPGGLYPSAVLCLQANLASRWSQPPCHLLVCSSASELLKGFAGTALSSTR